MTEKDAGGIWKAQPEKSKQAIQAKKRERCHPGEEADQSERVVIASTRDSENAVGLKDLDINIQDLGHVDQVSQDTPPLEFQYFVQPNLL
jgi:hypothetical protein